MQGEVDRYDETALAAFSRAVAHLAVRPRVQWDEPHGRKLKGRAGLYEVRYRANRCATRALGCFGPGEGQFTITLIATHKQHIYAPHDALATAERRYTQVVSGSATVAALTVDGEDFPPLDG